MLPMKRIPATRLNTLLAAASASEYADPSVHYPDWYLHRWHFLPDGYLTARGAHQYDRFIRPLYHAASESRTQTLLSNIVVSLRPGSVFEIGCGPGRTLAQLAAIPSVSLSGIDLSPFMLELAADRAGDAVQLRQANATLLPFKAESFDLVLALHVLGHMPPLEATVAAAEAVRVLRPGGRLVTVEHSWHHLEWPDSLEHRRHRRVGRGFARLRIHRRKLVAASEPRDTSEE